MPLELDARQRVKESERELERLEDDLRIWLAHRRKDDQKKQYKTQLDMIEARICGAIAIVKEDLTSVKSDRKVAEVYEECRLHDRRIFWIRWVWHFFQERFDQRDDRVLSLILKAADEVVWSCYHMVMDGPVKDFIPGLKEVAPLPFIESRYSPAAFPIGTLPSNLAGLKGEIDADFQRASLNTIPIPLLSLPPSCVGSPWWLVYIGHEIGHHIQSDLQLVETFSDMVVAAVKAKTDDPDSHGRWRTWSGEIFADFISVLTMGQFAVGAMAELELTQDEKMYIPKGRYPAPLVRLNLLAKAAKELTQTSVDPLLPDLPEPPNDDSEATKRLKADMELIDSVVDYFLGENAKSLTVGSGSITFKDLCGFRAEEFTPNGAVQTIVDLLQEESPPTIDDPDEPPGGKSLRKPRLTATATRSAWTLVLGGTRDAVAQDNKRRKLAAYATQLISVSGEETTRAENEAEESDLDKGDQLGMLLLTARPEQLEGLPNTGS